MEKIMKAFFISWITDNPCKGFLVIGCILGFSIGAIVYLSVIGFDTAVTALEIMTFFVIFTTFGALCGLAALVTAHRPKDVIFEEEIQYYMKVLSTQAR